MSFNGSGTFVINSTGQPVVANTVISATVFNALTADLASGLTNCITKDGQSTPTANIPMGSNKITGLANGTLIGDAANLGQVQSTVAKLISITGTDTVVGTMSPTLTAYAAGQLFYFIASGANTGAVTLNIDGLGAKAITRDGSTALAAGDINSGEIVVVIYDGTRFQMINAANSFGNTTINGTLTVTGNTGLQANVSVTSALSVGGTFAVTGAATLGSTLAVTGKSDLPTVSTASANAAVAVITDLSAAGASITSANVGTAVVTTGTVTNLTATSASVASVNAGVALLTTATVTNLTATGASIASANLGNAVISALTLTGVSVASANVGVANITDLRATGASVTSANVGTAVITTGTVTNLTATSASVASVNAAVALLTTATVTTLTASGASIASANIGNLQFTAASIASINAGVAVINNLTATSASIASMNGSVANITTVNATTVDATNVEVTNVKAKDGTAAITIADSTGNVGIGGTAAAFTKVHVLGTLPSSLSNSQHFRATGTIPSSSTAGAASYVSLPETQAASFTLTDLYHFYANQGTKGAGSSITNQYGFFADSAITGATNNYGFYSNIASGSNRWNFYAAGTADNYFAGPTTISVNSSSNALRITQVGSGNALLVEDSANPDSTPFVINGAGTVVSGHTSPIAFGSGFTPTIAAVSTGPAGVGAGRFSNSSNASFNLFRSRGSTVGTQSIVSSGDVIGAINWWASDGTNGIIAASISASVDGSPGPNDMPGRLVFLTTPASSATPTERMRINSSGNVKIGGTADRATTEGTNQLVLFNGTAPVGTLTNGVSFYSSSGEANVMDAAGNATLLSPHDSETNEWIFRSKHTPTGKVLKIDVEKMLRFINEHFGLDMVHEFTE